MLALILREWEFVLKGEDAPCLLPAEGTAQRQNPRKPNKYTPCLSPVKLSCETGLKYEKQGLDKRVAFLSYQKYIHQAKEAETLYKTS